MIANIYSGSATGGKWCIEPWRRLRDEEIEEACILFESLLDFQLPNSRDKRKWCNGKEPFSVKMVCRLLNNDKRVKEQLGLLNFPEARV